MYYYKLALNVLKSKDVQKLLVCTFVFVMVSSFVSPVYGGEVFDPVIYQNGNNPIPSDEAGFIVDDVIADDFVVPDGQIWEITDAHFTAELTDSGENPLLDPLRYFIFEDNGDVPGEIIASGVAQNTQAMVLGDPDDNRFEFWFNFEEDVPLNGGIQYWFGLKYTEDFIIIEPDPAWEISDVVNGNPAMASCCEFPSTIWDPLEFDQWFQLTGEIIIVDELCDIFPDDPQCIVGGELIPIETTSLLLANAQSFSWMIPIVLSGIGIGLFVVSRKSENS